MATPMFPGSGTTERVLGILSYVWVCCKSMMVVAYLKYMVKHS